MLRMSNLPAPGFGQPLLMRAAKMLKALESKAKVINVYFSMIPMQSEQTGNSLLEVGGNRQADPDNAYSPYRKRYHIPHGHIGDDAWHEAEIEFDFRDIPTAAYRRHLRFKAYIYPSSSEILGLNSRSSISSKTAIPKRQYLM